MTKSETIIIGASAAGLSCARVLQERNLDYILLEQHNHVGNAWRNHYDRLHLHTNKRSSNLPHFSFGNKIPKYPSRQHVVDYLDEYASKLLRKPVFNTEVLSINRQNDRWTLQTSQGEYQSKNIIIATGSTRIPKRVTKPGIESFKGKILHSAEYKNGQEFADKKVLIIGFGNSACEIAICLHEHGAKPAMSVRHPVNIIPKEILGIPVLSIGISQAWIPPKIADAINKPLLKLLIGDFTKYGLKKLPYGPAQQIINDRQIPLLDIGTLKLIRNGDISIYGDITKIDGHKIQFENNYMDEFDAIIMGTGYETGLVELTGISKGRLEDIRLPIGRRKKLGEDNLFFCGYFIAPTGMLREMGIEAQFIAEQIVRQRNTGSN